MKSMHLLTGGHLVFFLRYLLDVALGSRQGPVWVNSSDWSRYWEGQDRSAQVPPGWLQLQIKLVTFCINCQRSNGSSKRILTATEDASSGQAEVSLAWPSAAGLQCRASSERQPHWTIDMTGPGGFGATGLGGELTFAEQSAW